MHALNCSAQAIITEPQQHSAVHQPRIQCGSNQKDQNIFEQSIDGSLTVGELVGVVRLSQSALSQHLARLREDGLVVFRRTSQTLHYRVADKRALRVLQVLKEIFCGDVK